MAARAGGTRRKEVEDPNNTWNMQLMAAVLKNDITEAANLVLKGANVNHTVPEPTMKNAGVTPFIAVALRSAAAHPVGLQGNPNPVAAGLVPFADALNTLKWLCQHGADPNAQLDGNKGTLLHHCVRADLAELLDRVLLNRLVISAEPPPSIDAPTDAKDVKGRAKAGERTKDKPTDTVKLSLDPAPLPELTAAGEAVADADTPHKPREPGAPRDLFDLDARDDNGFTAFQLAVHLGKVEVGRVFLKHGARHELGVPVDGSRTQAARACAAGNAAALEVLLNLGDDPYQLDSSGQTLLHLSVQHSACLDLLLDRGVNPNFPNASGQSALSYVVLTSPANGDAIDALLARGADANVQDGLLGTTPLMHAVQGFAVEAVRRLLVDGKADVNVRDRFGATALHYAAVARNRTILEQLLTVEGIDVNAQDAVGQTALHRACFVHGKADFISVLLNKDAVDVNLQDKEGNTALHVATARGNEPAIRALFARVDATSITGPVPAGVPPAAPQAPAAGGKADAKKPPAKKGAPSAPEVTVTRVAVDMENAARLTALQIASSANSASIVQALVSIAANPRRASRFGNLVHESVVLQQPTLIRLLAGEKNAGVNDRNNDDRTPLHLAVETGIDEVVQAVLDCGAQPNDQDSVHLVSPLHIAVGLRHHSIRDALLRAGALVSVCDINARTPLHLACAVGDAATTQALLERGANVNARDADGRTPLHLACANDAVDCIDPLLAAGADFWPRDERSRAPLHIAVACAAPKCTQKLCDYIVGYNVQGAKALPRAKAYA
jgi:ankyrin repeat protein